MSTQNHTATVAKTIRQELKTTFPGVVFQVTTKHGTTVFVRWVDGPGLESVNTFVSKFRGTRFDEKADCYVNSNNAGVRFVQCERNLTSSFLRAAAEEYCQKYGHKTPRVIDGPIPQFNPEDDKQLINGRWLSNEIKYVALSMDAK